MEVAACMVDDQSWKIAMVDGSTCGRLKIALGGKGNPDRPQWIEYGTPLPYNDGRRVV
ncbi:hypothetical protein ABDI30_01280 [Paenibacillus cisolokensis]|uniref:hypothetical protein n=1 Tax=Paenibacillus cisolokensis TaxID=1658519 RepID=UPI003D28565F